jgi:hypothetical protein
MSDERTHGAESAIDDDLREPRMTAEHIRRASIESGRLVRDAVLALPESEDRANFLRIQNDLEEFWRHRASDSFCQQWLLVALKVGA